MKSRYAEEKYDEAADIADTINWNKVKNVNGLVKAGEVYEKVQRYEESREVLLMAYDRSPIGRMIIYRLAEVAVKMKDFQAAQDYYDEFVEIAPHDTLKYVLRYDIQKAQGASYEELIPILEELKEQEYTEEWAYELAYLYHKAGMSEKCIDACDELVLWFGDGPYVERALELKMLYQPLTKTQEEKYRSFCQKAIGISNFKIRSLYLTKYLMLVVIGAFVGFFVSIPFSDLLLRSVSSNMVLEADNHFLLSVLGAILVVIVILLYAFRCTKLVKKSSPIDAIRSGQTGERYKKKSPFRLVKSHGSIGFFMAVNDVFSAPRRYMTIITTFFLCTLFVLVFVNVSSTMRSDTFITTFGTRSDLYYTDLTEAMSCMNSDGRKQIEEYFAKTEALFKKNGMPAKLCVETQYKYKVHFDGKDYSISCQQGIHTKASAYEYINGVVPQNKNEIAITPMVSKLTGAKLGDTVTIDFGKETLDCVVVAYFQSMNQLGEVIRLHEDAPTDFTYIANVMSYQIDFDDHPSAKEIEIRKEKIKKLFDNEKVMNATEYCDDCMGAASTMESVQYLLLGITLIVVLLVCILMERSFLADEKSQIAVLKAMGFGNKRVMEWHMTRFGIVTLVAVFLAAICSIPATYLIGNPIFGMMGAGKVAYVIRPWKIFFLYPGIIFLMTLLASGMTALQIRTIKSNDTTNIE